MESCSSPLGHGLGELRVTIAYSKSESQVDEGGEIQLTRKNPYRITVMHESKLKFILAVTFLRSEIGQCLLRTNN